MSAYSKFVEIYSEFITRVEPYCAYLESFGAVQKMMSYQDQFTKFCTFVVVVQLLVLLRWIYQNVLKQYFCRSVDFKKFGKWALVTGATDGIGKEYARQLAERGLNIVLVSRSLSKLENVAQEIRKSFGVETLVIDVDFTGGPEIYDKIRSEIKGKEIGILVNNIGIGNAAPGYFLSYPDREKFTQDLIKCNVTSIPTMCSIVMPQMVKRKCGLVINLSSFLGVTCSTMAAAYGASKAFAHKFSEDLADDYKDDGIIVQTLMPGFVVTNMSKFASSNVIIPSTRDYVKSALKTVGVTRYTAGYLPHALLMYVSQLIRFLSPSLSRAVTRLPMKYLLYRESKYRGYKPATVIE